MVCIDSTRCNGCGRCVAVCPQQAITIDNSLAVINQELCIQCGACSEVCSAGAIREVAPAHEKIWKGGERMTYGYGRGFGRGSGRRGGAGLGFRGISPPWPYAGRGRGGLPRCWHPDSWAEAPYPAPPPYWLSSTGEGELGFLRDQAGVMKSQLENIERQIQELEKKE